MAYWPISEATAADDGVRLLGITCRGIRCPSLTLFERHHAGEI